MSKTRGEYRKNYLRDVRDLVGMSLQTLADRAGMTNQQVSNIELSKSRMSLDQLYKFSNILECHPADITDGPSTEKITPETDEERQLLQKYRGLNEKDQGRFIQMLRAYADTE